MSKGLVLVSGATGFIGTDVSRAFVDAGYTVRGTTRSRTKADQWEKFNPGYAGKIEWSIVPDGAAPNAYDEAVDGVDYVVHTSGPVTYDIKDKEKDMLLPTINSTNNMLSAAKKEPRVKHFVLTSSIATMLDILELPAIGTTYTRDSWNPATWEQALSVQNNVFTYCAAKLFAEKAVLDDTERAFPVTVLCPCRVIGPPSQPLDSLASINLSLIELHHATINKPILPGSIQFGADVRDVALCHVNALTAAPPLGSPPNFSRRFLVSAWSIYTHEFADALLSHPDLSPAKVPGGVDFKTRVSSDRSKDPVYDHFDIDSRPTEEVLLGRPWMSKEKSFVDMALRFLELEKQLGENH